MSDSTRTLTGTAEAPRHTAASSRSAAARLGTALLLTTLAALAMGMAAAQECTKYVSSEGSGRTASLERPARDMGNIASDLVPGDVVCITGGVFTGRADAGADLIEVPVAIYGGFSPDFASRDPWGAHRTVFTGVRNSPNFSTDYRLTIDTTAFATKLMAARGEQTEHSVIVDGIIFDNGDRNYYAGGENSKIIRLGTPSETPTPESGGLVIRTGITSTVEVRNVIVMNTAPTQGAIALFPGAAAQVTVTNNVAVNNTGAGFHLGTNVAASDPADMPTYTFTDNVSVFNEKHDAFSTFGGAGVILESGTHVAMTGNILAFNDNYGIDNAKRADDIVVVGNVITHNAQADYLEFDTKIGLADLEDWAEYVAEGWDNVALELNFGVSPEWGTLYASRNVIDRNAAEAEVEVVDAWYNDVRSFFGWELVGTDLSVDSNIWLPRISIEDALAVAVRIDGAYGVMRP
jgi:hypothetical protein